LTGFEEDSRFEVTEHVRSVGGREGAVLLDLRSGKYLALNDVGGRIWQGIERGEPRAAILARLEAEIEAPAGRVREDADTFLSQLLDRGLIRLAAAPVAAPPARSVPAGAASEEEEETAAEALRLRPLWVLLAWLGLLVADVVLHLLGFHRFHALLRRIPIRLPERGGGTGLATALSQAVDQAAAFYFKRAWCLQRSAVAMALLRLRGLPAKLVIGIHQVPFHAHAWVELRGRVINDRPWLPEAYAVIESC
jgi:transglutaminase superfamily protein/coenzyme PQQ synthesis protein D (PqqD)